MPGEDFWSKYPEKERQIRHGMYDFSVQRGPFSRRVEQIDGQWCITAPLPPAQSCYTVDQIERGVEATFQSERKARWYLEWLHLAWLASEEYLRLKEQLSGR